MKKFLGKVILFTGIISVLVVVYCYISTYTSTKYFGPNTTQQITVSFENAIKEDYDCYILGNSRIYRGINPDKLDMHAYNFAHDNDTYNQMYYKLIYLLQNNSNIDTVILGTDYFQFSFFSNTRNYIYNRLLGKDYIKDYADRGENNYVELISDYWKSKRANISICIKFLLGHKPEPLVANLKDNGQYITYGYAKENDTVERDNSILDIQYDYLEKIINLCEKENIKVYIVMPPARDAELASYTQEEMDTFDNMICEMLGDKTSENYFNCSNLEQFKGYENYTDITHLNEKAADEYSEYLNSILN